MINRRLGDKIKESAKKLPVIVVTGPRQSGKSTLIQALFPDYTYQNLEDPEIRHFANSDPKGFLQNSGSFMILDEVQNAPHLLSYIQVITDRKNPRTVYPLRITKSSSDGGSLTKSCGANILV